MSALTQAHIEAALATYTDPYLDSDLVSAGCVRDIRVGGDAVEVDIHLSLSLIHI